MGVAYAGRKERAAKRSSASKPANPYILRCVGRTPYAAECSGSGARSG